MIAWPASLAARPLLIYEPHVLEFREAFLDAERALAEPQAAAAGYAGDRPRYAVLDGVAVIPILGALISRGDFMGDGFRFTSYGAVAREVNRAAGDPRIRGIVLAISSPGGTVDGVLSAAGAIRAARAQKPVVAHVTSMAASAGYWLAAQSDEIVLNDDLTVVGSIGVYTMHMDISKLLTDAGIDVTLISSGAHKVDGHPFAPLPEAVRGRIQTEVDDLRLMFAREVAAGRGPLLTERAALATEARVYRALNPRTGDREAITNKLADRVGSLDAVVRSLRLAADDTHNKVTTKMQNTEITTAAAEREQVAAGWRRAVATANQQRFGIAPAATERSADTAAEPAAAGWSKAIAEANADLLARHGGAVEVEASPSTTDTSPAIASGWAKAVAAANKRFENTAG